MGLMELLDFLRARLDEDEQVARAAESPYGDWSTEQDGDPDAPIMPEVLIYPERGGDITVARTWPHEQGRADATHIARHDPARVLREVEAKRELVRQHGPMSVRPGSEYFNDAHLTREPMRLCRTCEPPKMFRREKSWPCPTIRLLAVPYANHPDYDEAWKP